MVVLVGVGAVVVVAVVCDSVWHRFLLDKPRLVLASESAVDSDFLPHVLELRRKKQRNVKKQPINRSCVPFREQGDRPATGGRNKPVPPQVQCHYQHPGFCGQVPGCGSRRKAGTAVTSMLACGSNRPSEC